MNRILTISDIHGYGVLLEQLLTQAAYNPQKDRLYLLGDYLNKGPDTEGTIKYVRKLVERGAIALRGNHEERIIEGVCKLPFPDPNGEWHHFLKSMPLWYEDEQYIYVHAGLKPGIPLDRQAAEDLTSIRDEFYDYPTTVEKRVIFGHTCTTILGAKEGHIWDGGDKLGIDTGAARGKYLTLLDLTEFKIYTADVSHDKILELDS